VKMNTTSFELEDFNAPLYLRALVAVAASDGIHPAEEGFIRQQAAAFGVDADDLLSDTSPAVGALVEGASPMTRRIIYRDCFILAHVDGMVSDEERAVLADLRGTLGLTPEKAGALESWAERYSAILAEGESLLTSP